MRILIVLLLIACGSSESTEAETEPAAVASGDETSVEPVEPEQSVVEALDIMCNQSVEAPEFVDATPDNKAIVLARWIRERLSNQTVLELFDSLGDVDAETRIDRVNAQVGGAGLERCALVELWAR